MVDFKGLEGLYDDINQVGSRPVGLMTEFKTEAGRPIYISHSGEIVSEKSTTIPYNGKYVNVPSIHDGIEYSEFELIKLLDEKKIKPTSTHKTQELAVKAAQKRSPSLMSEETARAVESKYGKEMTKRKASADQILGDSSTELVTPEAKANIQMRNLELINEDPFLGLVDPSEKTDKLDAYMSTLSEQDKLNIQKMLKKPKASINSIEGDEAMAKGRARRNDVDETITAFNEGGLKDEGGTVDPVSGNEVPSGSNQKEVRDDIPAQLSEGEFVFPADVVRYIGLENLMELRQKAKVGLARMEAMGQMGNSEEAIIDDSGEYNDEIDQLIDNLDPNDPESMEFQTGGAVLPNYLGTTPPQQQFSYGFMPPPQQGFQAPGYSVMPQQSQFITSPARTAVGQPPVSPELRRYVGPNGEILMIPFYDGKPMKGYTVPGGYKYKPEEEAVAETPEVAAPTVAQPDSDGDDRAREEEEAGRIAQEKELNNLLAKYDPAFAKVIAEDPFMTGKLANPYTALMATFNTVGARTETIPGVLEKFGIPVADFEVPGIGGKIPGNKYDVGKLANTLRTADLLVEQFGIEEDKINDIIAYTNLDTDGDGRVTKDDLVDKSGKFTKAGRDLFMDLDDGTDPADAPPASTPTQRGKDITAEVRADLADRGLSTSDSPDDRDSEDSGTAGDRNDPSDPGGGFGPSFSKGGAVQQTQRALKSSRKK
jgi:hypothetical protein